MSEIDSVAPDEVRVLVEDGALLVDVRTRHEWDAGRIAGATHIELSELDERAPEFDRERPIVFYCRGGERSDMAASAFAADGYKTSALAGGILAWEEAGLPLEPDDAYVAESGEAAAILEARRRED